MDPTEISTAVVTALKDIAPEVAQEDLTADSPLREQVDLDSMDWLNFLVRLHTKFGVDIPEADYRQLVTLRDVTEYLATRMAGR